MCKLGMELNLIHHEAWPSVFAPVAAPERDRDFWQASLLKDGALVLIAEIDGEAAGMVTAQLCEESSSLMQPHRFCRIGSIAVSVSHRGNGVGRRLMSALEAWAALQGASDLRLTVWDFNQRAMAFYEELGYETRSHMMSKPLPAVASTAMAAACELRRAQAGDAIAISALIRQFTREFTVSADGSGAEQFLASVSAEAESGYISDPRYCYINAFSGEVLAGFIAMRDRSHLFHLFVAPQFQRQGLARRLWHAAQASAPESQAFTVNSSPSALPAYQRLGFAPAGAQVEMHGIRFVPMRLSLN